MKRFSNRVIASILVVVLAIGAASGYLAYHSYAARTLDESQTVTFAEFSARHNIPDTTIFIGAHLITLESATDELWERAIESQSQADQERIYYKSELASGTWYDITDAESIRDINGEGNSVPIPEEDLAELLVMYYTFNYGITRLAVDDSRHCIFDGDYDYWDLYHLDELESIRQQYDIIVSRNNEDSYMDTFYRNFLNQFFNRDLRNAVTQKADDALYTLQDIYDALVAAERKDDADIIYKLMAKLDNKRRAEIFRQLADESDIEEYTETEDEQKLTPLQKLLRKVFQNLGVDSADESLSPEPDNTFINILDELLQKAEGTGYVPEDDEEFITNYDVVDAIGTDTGECQNAYLEKSNNTLEVDGSRIIDELIYEISKNIIDNAADGLSTEMDSDITRLGYLFNIDDEKVVHKEEELAIIDDELLSQVTDKFASKALAKPSDEYFAALDAGASDSALSGFLDLQENEVDSIRLELQDVIKAKTDRMSVDDAMAFTYDRINLTQDMMGQLKQTDFISNAKLQIKRHIKWLTDLLAELYEKSKSGESELDKLIAQADAMLLNQQKALDKNDYKSAKEINAAREAVLAKIEELTGKLKDIMNDPNASAGDKALAQTILNGGYPGLDAILQKITDGIIEKMNAGEDIGDDIDLLKTLGDENGLNQIKQEATDNGNEQALNQVNEALEDYGDDDIGLSEDDLLALLNSILGDINSLSSEQLASAIRAMEMIYDMGYTNAGSLSARLAGIAKTKGNKYIYTRLNDSGQYEYVSLYTLAKVAGYRWTYDNAKRTNALIGSGINPTYQIAAGDKYIYEVVNKDTRNPVLKRLTMMNDKARATSNLYATVDVCSKYFNCVACHIKKSNYGICITNKMEGDAQTLRDQLLPSIQGTN